MLAPGGLSAACLESFVPFCWKHVFTSSRPTSRLWFLGSVVFRFYLLNELLDSVEGALGGIIPDTYPKVISYLSIKFLNDTFMLLIPDMFMIFSDPVSKH